MNINDMPEIQRRMLAVEDKDGWILDPADLPKGAALDAAVTLTTSWQSAILLENPNVHEIGQMVDTDVHLVMAALKVWKDQLYRDVYRGMLTDVRRSAEPNQRDDILKNVVCDVRALASAFGFYVPASIYKLEALIAGSPDPIEDGKRRLRELQKDGIV